MGEIGLIAEFTALKERGVEKISPIDSPGFGADYPRTVLYFTRPKVALMQHIARHIQLDHDRHEERTYTLFFVPRRTVLCERRLQQDGVFANLSIAEYPLHFAPLDSDVLSMELPLCFRECALLGDRSELYYTAAGLMQLQAVFGLVPRIVGKGELARHVADLMLRMNREAPPVTATPEIEAVVLVDRSVDLVSPMCTQLTFEGLTDELLGISATMVELPPAVAPPGPGGKPAKIELNSGDKLFAEIRDMHMSAVGALLSQRARNLRAEYEERHDAKTVSQIHSFTSKLKRMQDDQQSLRRHTDLAAYFNGVAKADSFTSLLEAEQLMLAQADPDKPVEYVEDCIGRKEPLDKVLRLVCLHSVLCNGLKPKVFESYRRDIINTYGHEHLLTLENLAKTALLSVQEGKAAFPLLRKHLRLVYDEQRLDAPADIGYVHSGYAPLSVRLAQVLSGDWRAHEELLRLLPGPTFELSQALPPGLAPRARDGEGTRPAVTLVVFVGGCTYAEISAVRFLSKHTEAREYVVATTSILNGRSLIDSLTQKAA